MRPEITNPFGALSKKHDDHPQIVARMEYAHMNGYTVKELRDLVGQETMDILTIMRGKIVSFDGPCMADDCKRTHDPEIGNYCCRPVFTVQYGDQMDILHLDELWLIRDEQRSSLPW